MGRYTRPLHIAVLLLCAGALGACQPGWIRLDGAAASASELQRANLACDVDNRLAQLEAADSDSATRDGAINDNEARMLRLEDRDNARRRVAREIEDCMRRQGLRPAD